MQDAIENLNKKLMGLTKSNSDLLQQLGEREKQIQKLGSLLSQNNDLIRQNEKLKGGRRLSQNGSSYNRVRQQCCHMTHLHPFSSYQMIRNVCLNFLSFGQRQSDIMTFMSLG